MHATAVFLPYDQLWDNVEASGYRLITSLQSAPAELRDLPLGDRLYIRSVNERIGVGKDAREAVAHAGGMRFAVSRLVRSLALISMLLSATTHRAFRTSVNTWSGLASPCMYL